jgi:dihydrofolate reductase
MAENRVIGRNNTLPWHLPADLKRFKALTTGGTLIMGRHTFDAIGKALPGRRTIVLSRDSAWRGTGVEVAHDLDEAIELAAGDSEVFVGGGAQVYRQAMPLADRMHLTLVHTIVEGDAHFPPIPPGEWTIAEEEKYPADEKNAFAMTFRRYERSLTSQKKPQRTAF